MGPGWLVAIEGLLIFGLVIGFAVWEIRKLNRDKKGKSDKKDER